MALLALVLPIFGILFTIIWFSFKSLIKSIRESLDHLSKEINAMKLDLARKYAEREEVNLVREDAKKSRHDLWTDMGKLKDRMKALEILTKLSDPKAKKVIQNSSGTREEA
jgi:cell shape-determining protein MreC